MNQRDWIEFGKMYERVVASGYKVSLVNDGDKFCVIFNLLTVESLPESSSVKVIQKATTSKVEWFDTPYLAMKFQYFNYYLDEYGYGKRYEDVSVDIDDETYNKLCVLSDEKGITLDELVSQVLEEIMKEEEPVKDFDHYTVLHSEDILLPTDEYFDRGQKEWLPLPDNIRTSNAIHKAKQFSVVFRRKIK